ncbi:hypothetical protein [Orientia tsutsugamushi]|uniref:hypothetical protein n=1 Tax=Orientia tsutsugamushi TaxID=784 RepID=UPI000B0C21C6|nr:hypothetical protein [Orientia tsutsugamushi]
MSLQQAGIKGNIIASVGIMNLKNHSPFQGKKIIIAADNDGKNLQLIILDFFRNWTIM